jgi:hypothetical protein
MREPDIIFYSFTKNDPKYLVDVLEYFAQEGYEKYPSISTSPSMPNSAVWK